MKTVIASSTNLLVFIVTAIALTTLYYWALVQSVPFATFLQSNSPLFVVSQFLLTLINVVLGAIAITLIIELTRRQRQSSQMNIFQSFISLFISVATTGCYICGNILLPGIGIATSFASLPFGGLEIKVLTALLLAYSIRDLNQKLLGTCKIYRDRWVQFDLSGLKLKFNYAWLQRSRPALVSLFLVVLIFALPYIVPQMGFSINDPSHYSCKQ